MNMQVGDKNPVTLEGRITRLKLELVKAFAQGPKPDPTLLYAQLRNAGQKAGNSLSSSS